MKQKSWSGVIVSMIVGVMVAVGPASAQVPTDPGLLAEFDLAYGRNGRDYETEPIGALSSMNIATVMVYPDFGNRFVGSAGVYPNTSYEDRNFGVVPRAELLTQIPGMTLDVTWPNYRQNNNPLMVGFHAADLNAYCEGPCRSQDPDYIRRVTGRTIRFRLTDPENGRSQTFTIRFQLSDQVYASLRDPVAYGGTPPAAPKAGDPCIEERGACGELICLHVTPRAGADSGWRLYDAKKSIPCVEGDTARFATACTIAPVNFPTKGATCTGSGWKFDSEL